MLIGVHQEGIFLDDVAWYGVNAPAPVDVHCTYLIEYFYYIRGLRIVNTKYLRDSTLTTE